MTAQGHGGKILARAGGNWYHARMKWQSYLSTLLLMAATVPVYAAGEKAPAKQPNIIMVLVDDLGWGDLSFCPDLQGQRPQIPTPRLADMAQNGTMMSRHYTAAPVCAPARASLFSGVHQGHAEVVRNNSFDAALENSHTLASVLKQAGYATALIGKWGIGGGVEGGGTPQTAAAWPTRRGFDYFFGYHNHIAGHRHYPKEESNADPETHANAVWDGDKIITADLDNCYSTDLFTARAKKWVQDHRAVHPDQPFFLALTLIAPHARLAVPSAPYPADGVQWLGTPGHMINTATGNWDSFIDPRVDKAADTAEWKEHARSLGNEKNTLLAARRHGTMVARVDDAMGDLVDTCRKLGIDKDTFIVFLSDNGPHNEPGAVGAMAGHPAPRQNPAFFRSYGGADGIKRDVWDGGLRVPCLVYAPGIVKPGQVNMQPSQFQDWMATFADLAGVPRPMRCDGVSLLPTLSGNAAAQEQGVVYSEYKFDGAMQFFPDYADNKRNRTRGEQQVLYFRSPQGKLLKAIRSNIRTGQEDFEIYDTAADPHETRNLAADHATLQPVLKAAVLQNRRAYDYARDNSAGKRNNACDGKRNYDGLAVPSVKAKKAVTPGLLRAMLMRTDCPWVPEFSTLPGAKEAATTVTANPAAAPLPGHSISNLKGYINIPAEGTWHFYLTLDAVEGSKAYVRMHKFQLIDADFSYTPGTTATESAAANTQEANAASTGKRGIPLAAGLHPIEITAVQGNAPGTLKLEWEGPGVPRSPIPAEAFRH